MTSPTAAKGREKLDAGKVRGPSRKAALASSLKEQRGLRSSTEPPGRQQSPASQWPLLRADGHHDPAGPRAPPTESSQSHQLVLGRQMASSYRQCRPRDEFLFSSRQSEIEKGSAQPSRTDPTGFSAPCCSCCSVPADCTKPRDSALPRCVRTCVLHSTVVLAALYLCVGLILRSSRRSPFPCLQAPVQTLMAPLSSILTDSSNLMAVLFAAVTIGAVSYASVLLRRKPSLSDSPSGMFTPHQNLSVWQ